MNIKLICLVLLFLTLCNPLFAAVVVLKTGEILEGRIISQNESTIVINDKDRGEITLSTDEISSIEYGDINRTQTYSQLKSELEYGIYPPNEIGIDYADYKRKRFDEGFFWTPSPSLNAILSMSIWGMIMGFECQGFVSSVNWGRSDYKDALLIALPLTGAGLGMITGTILSLYKEFQVDDFYMLDTFGMTFTLNALAIAVSIPNYDDLSLAAATLPATLLGISTWAVVNEYVDMYGGTADLIQSSAVFIGGFGFSIAYTTNLFEDNLPAAMWIGTGFYDLALIIFTIALYDRQISLEFAQIINLTTLGGGLVGTGLIGFTIGEFAIGASVGCLLMYGLSFMLLEVYDYDLELEAEIKNDFFGRDILISISPPAFNLVYNEQTKEYEMPVYLPTLSIQF